MSVWRGQKFKFCIWTQTLYYYIRWLLWSASVIVSKCLQLPDFPNPAYYVCAGWDSQNWMIIFPWEKHGKPAFQILKLPLKWIYLQWLLGSRYYLLTFVALLSVDRHYFDGPCTLSQKIQVQCRGEQPGKITSLFDVYDRCEVQWYFIFIVDLERFDALRSFCV